MEIKKAISQEEMRKTDMSRRPPPASSFYGGRDQYGAGAYGGRSMGFADYSRMQSKFAVCLPNSLYFQTEHTLKLRGSG